MGVSKTSDSIQIKIKMPDPSQEPPVPSKATDRDFKDIDVLCTFKIKIESKNLYHGYIKDQWTMFTEHIQIKIKMLNSSLEPPDSSKAPNEEFRDMNVLCTFKIKTESKNSDHGCIKSQWPYTNQDQDAIPQSRTSSILQNLKHGCIKDQWPYLNQD